MKKFLTWGGRALSAAMVVSLLAAPSWGQLVVSADTNANNLVTALLSGSGIPFSNATYSGGFSGAGYFANGLSVGLGIDEGILLSSGNVLDAPGPNSSDSMTTTYFTAGDPDLDVLAGVPTTDAARLQFDFTANEGDDLVFRYVFASDEYNEYVGNLSFNDPFAFYLDGVNIALAPSAPPVPVTVSNVNGISTPALYNDNDPSDLGFPTPFDIEYDGFTVVFTASSQDLAAGQHTIKLAIADASDSQWDSTVFIEGEFLLVENDPPVADLIGPYFADVTTPSITLDASGSTDDGNLAPLTYSWDLDDDGFFDDAFSGNSPLLPINSPYAFFGSAGTYPVGVQVFDGQFFSDASSLVFVVPEPISVSLTVAALVPWLACMRIFRRDRTR
jgi:hypothetical protein